MPVLTPDITYKINDPGMSAVWCVLPALEAAIATGIVDAKKVGLTGHSWGGYQTSFLVTQTDMFAAAVAGAPLTNMISMYSLIYKNTGGTNQAIFESSQGRFKGGYWDKGRPDWMKDGVPRLKMEEHLKGRAKPTTPPKKITTTASDRGVGSAQVLCHRRRGDQETVSFD